MGNEYNVEKQVSFEMDNIPDVTFVIDHQMKTANSLVCYGYKNDGYNQGKHPVCVAKLIETAVKGTNPRSFTMGHSQPVNIDISKQISSIHIRQNRCYAQTSPRTTVRNQLRTPELYISESYRDDTVSAIESAIYRKLLQEIRFLSLLDQYEIEYFTKMYPSNETYDLSIDGTDYKCVVYEYGGESLQQALETKHLPEKVTNEIIRQTGAALDIMHDKGLVHRDIKPSNILLNAKDGVLQVKLTDLTDSVKIGDVSDTHSLYFGDMQNLTNIVTKTSDQYQLALTILHMVPQKKWNEQLIQVIKKGTAANLSSRYSNCVHLCSAAIQAIQTSEG